MGRGEHPVSQCILTILAGLLVLLSFGLSQADQSGESAPFPDNGLSVEIKPGKSKIYMHESIPVDITLTYPDNLDIHDIQYPRLDGTAFSIGGFGPPRHGSEVREGQNFAVYDFKTVLTPGRSGTIRLGPAEISCEQAVPTEGPAAFFGGTDYRRVTVRSAVVPLAILPLPRQGKPSAFAGAVGQFTLNVTVRPDTVRMEDPITIRATITGTGNLAAVSCPMLNLDNRFRAYGNRIERSERKIVCEDVVAPLTADADKLPPITFSFFDPAAARYRTLRKGPFPIKVAAAPPEIKSAASRETAPGSPSRQGSSSGAVNSDFIGKSLAFFDGSVARLFFSAVLVLVWILLIAGYFRRRKNSQMADHCEVQPFARKKRATLESVQRSLEEGNPSQFSTQLFRALQEILGERYSVSPGSVTKDIVRTAIPPGSIDSDTLHAIETLFAECDMVRYAAVEMDRARMESSYAELHKIESFLKPDE
jgi:hypothetical protein